MSHSALNHSTVGTSLVLLRYTRPRVAYIMVLIVEIILKEKKKWSYLHFSSIYSLHFPFFPFIFIFLKSNFLKLFIETIFLYPLLSKFRGVYKNHSVCLPVCYSLRLSVQIHVRPITFLVWNWLTIFGTWVYHYHYERMCLVHSWFLTRHWLLTSRSN